VLVDNADNYRKDPIQRRILASGLADGLLSVEGDRWLTQRRTLAPLFARRTVTSFTAAMLAAADRLAERWRSLGTGATIDVAAEMALLTLNVLALTIFSDGIAGDYDEFREAMNAYFAVIGRIGALDLLGVPQSFPRPGGGRLRRTMSYFEGIIDRIIDARRGRLEASPLGDGPSDLLTLLLRALDPSTGQSMSLTEVRSNILTFLSAGHETTANSLTWSIFLLSQAPDWRARVREEAARELAGPLDGLADRLVVTRAVVEEALRLYPPIAALSRMAKARDTLSGATVKAGALIVIAPYVLHRHRLLWDRPDAFDPSRFMPENRGAVGRFAYLPFGIGPRICIGASFALQEATIVLAALTHRFDIELMPGAKVWPLQKITLRPAGGLPMRVSPRACDEPPAHADDRERIPMELPSGHELNADQIAYWNGPGGQRWADRDASQETLLRPIAEVLIARAAPKPGDRVLDVGCGAGSTTIMFAKALAPNGFALGLDISAPMLARAREVAPKSLPLDFVMADATVYPFDPQSFDLLASRFGVMFFADPVLSFSNLRRALKPSGRLAFVCWREPRENPWMMTPLQAVYQHVPKMPPVGPEDPGPFAFASEERVRRILTGAGFTGVEMAPHNLSMDIAIGGGLEAAVEGALQIGPASRALQGHPPETHEAAKRSIREVLTPFVRGQSVLLPGAIWVVTARAS
jgi:cytochrome P450/SAM-dependent methyltransferase